jgi:hypothetical protein
LRRISDTLCVRHGLYVIEDPKPSRGSYGSWLGTDKKPSFHDGLRQKIDEAIERKPDSFDTFLDLLRQSGVVVDTSGKYLKLRLPGQAKNTRCNTLKGDYTEAVIRERIAGKRAASPTTSHIPQAQNRVGLLIDIEAAMQAGKGAGYERWAKIYNLKQLSQAVIYLKEHGDMTYEELVEKFDAAALRFGELTDRIKTAEAGMKESAALQKHIINYAKTRDVYTAYRKAGYSGKFKDEHEADILIHQAAKKAFDELGVKKLPTVRALREQYAAHLTEKKKAYSGYKKAKAEMKELLAVKAGVDSLLNRPERERNRHKIRYKTLSITTLL